MRRSNGRFQPVLVGEPSVEDTISDLRGLRERYEIHHKVRLKDSALVAAAVLSHRYITDRFLPDKAIDLMDEAASKLRMEIHSMPVELDEVARRIMQLEIEREALRKETDKASLEAAGTPRKGARRSQGRMVRGSRRIGNRRRTFGASSELKEQLEEARRQKQDAERSGDFARASELQYGRMPELEMEASASRRRSCSNCSIRIGNAQEEVDEEDIAEVVANDTTSRSAG